MHAATGTAAEIDCVLATRGRAMLDAARELFGALTPKDVSAADARRALIETGRACLAPPYLDCQCFLVLYLLLHQRSRYYALRD